MAPHPLIGQAAPAITLPSATEESYTLDPSTSTRPIVLFFYPAAFTHGCTKEVCSFRDAQDSEIYKNTNVQIVGISGDAVEKQKRFAEEHKLSYPLLCDTESKAKKAYHVGKGLFGLTEARTTFVIDNGKVEDVFDSVLNFGGHEKFVTKWLATKKAPATQ